MISTSPTPRRRLTAAALAAVTLIAFGLTACEDNSETAKRQQQAQQSANKDTLEKRNLAAKLKIEEDANRTGYVYLMSFAKPIGYYVIKGKVSSNGSQIDPENLIDCPYSCSAPVVIDGPQDDGTYGEGDPGIFFFTVDGTMVVTSLDYFYSTQPVPSAIDVPKLG